MVVLFFIVGLAVSLLSALLGLPPARAKLKAGFKTFHDAHFDWARFAAIVVGIAIAAIAFFINRANSARKDQELTAAVDYNDMALLGPVGDSAQGIVLIGHQDVTFPALQELWHSQGSVISLHCNDDATEHLAQNVISLEPRFPFTYYALAICHHLQGKPDWRENADRAIQIFEKTTLIAGRRPQFHDRALQDLRRLEDGGQITELMAGAEPNK